MTGYGGKALLLVSVELDEILALADRVLLLSSTGIADSGSHTQLLHRNPTYRELLGIEHG